MLLTRLNPFVHNEWNRLLEDFANRARPVLAGTFPPVNLWEDNDRLVVEAELPGLTHDEIEILVEGDQLTLRGERKPSADNGRWHRQERGYGKFQRVFTLPVAVDADKIEATLTQGVLTVTLPKSAATKSRKIQVKAS